MTLRLALCFLFHQNLGEQAAQASRISYRGLLDVLRNHPRMKFNLMLSGTLLDALCWFDPSLLETVRSGVERGSFRLLGSTYAQSLLLAGDDWDNAHQIALHRRTLRKYFGAEPAAFWSPQRTWSPRLAPMLARSGYRFLPLEGRTLRAAGASEPCVYQAPADENTLKILWDDEPLRARFVFAAWFRRAEALRETLSAWKTRADAERLFPVCSEDAGAFGLWGYEAGLDPRADWIGLDGALDEIESDPALECAFVEEAPEPAGAMDPLPESWGTGLDRALADSEAPHYEEGYSDWHDFFSRAPRIQHFRRIHGAVRTRMISAEGKIPPSEPENDSPGETLFRLAVQSFCAHQTEFGRVGIGGRGDPAWEGVGAALAVAKAAELSCAPAPSAAADRVSIDDVTGDGEEEILLRSGDHLAVLSPFGGRLLHWIDLRQGRLHIGNPLAVPVGLLLIEARSPEPAPLPDDWMPSEGDPLSEAKEEPAPGRRLSQLAREFLPECLGSLPVWPRPCRAGLRPAHPARRRALNDFLSIDDGPEEPPEPRLDFRLAEGAVTFLRFFGYRLRMIKRVRLTAGGLRVMYRFWNEDSRAIRVHLRIVSELCPDYQAVLESPGRALEPVCFGPRDAGPEPPRGEGRPVRFGTRRRPGILNLRTDSALVCHASRRTSEPAAFQPAVLAWELAQTFAFIVEPRKTEMLILRLNIYPASLLAQGVLLTG